MRSTIRNIAFAIALTASAGSILAQQQPYGRDSVYANPAHATRQTRVVLDSTTGVRSGRDSVYATASSSSTPVAADATGLQRYGRESIYAIQVDNPDVRTGETRVGQAPSDRSTN